MTARIDGKQCADDLATLNGAIVNATAQAVRGAVKDTVDHARATTLFNDRSGKTRQSIRGEANGPEGEVKAGGVAKFLENGTAPHEIKPRRAKKLRFVVNGEVAFARKVNHPGTAERPFMTQARDLGEKSLEYGLEFLVDEAIKRSK